MANLCGEVICSMELQLLLSIVCIYSEDNSSVCKQLVICIFLVYKGWVTVEVKAFVTWS